MIYDLIIIGAGAAGLFAGATLPNKITGLILEKSAAPGRKLLMSGSGQCNLTHGGSIKDFISHYGVNGNKARTILYRYNNESVIRFFTEGGIPLFEREDGKIFPKSLRAGDILEYLTERCRKNGMELRFSSPVEKIVFNEASEKQEGFYTLHCGSSRLSARKIIVSSGGCSYPTTGSDGSLFHVLEMLGLTIQPLKPALVPVFVHNYPYRELSGIAFQNASVSFYSEDKKLISEDIGPLLFTHNSFSGPGILNQSRYVKPGMTLSLNYCPGKTEAVMLKELSNAVKGSGRQFLTELSEYLNNRQNTKSETELPKRFLDLLCKRAGIDPSAKAASVPHSQLRAIVTLILNDSFTISQTGDFKTAMVTSGGVSIDEINTKTMESKKYPGMFFAGEVLDIDGDTGGYNLQFAFSSGWLAANSIARTITTSLSYNEYHIIK